jgi:geranylgeranyl diphosphate synthase type I
MGAISANASAAQCDAFAAYGMQLGVAFQEQDDLLGVWGRASETGKPDAADVVERKRGLPAAMALSRSDAPDWLRRTYLERDGALADETVRQVIEHFDRLELRDAIERRVEARYAHALDALDRADAREPARGYLTAICEALVARRT